LKHFLRFYGPAILWAALILTFSSLPRLHPPDLGFRSQDKLAHAFEYGVFGWLLFRSFNASAAGRAKAFRMALAVGTVFAAFDEWHQLYIPGRAADLFDFLADAAGVGISQLAVFFRLRRGKAAVD